MDGWVRFWLDRLFGASTPSNVSFSGPWRSTQDYKAPSRWLRRQHNIFLAPDEVSWPCKIVWGSCSLQHNGARKLQYPHSWCVSQSSGFSPRCSYLVKLCFVKYRVVIHDVWTCGKPSTQRSNQTYPAILKNCSRQQVCTRSFMQPHQILQHGYK